MRIRSVGIEGAGQLAEMDKHCFSDSWKEKDWQQFLSLPQYRCYIVTAEELPKGFLLISTAADEGEIIKIGVLPLSKKLNEGAEKIYTELCKYYNCEYDDRGNIGKRYRRQDEIGTPFCVTYDFESEEDGAVTVRDRDTMEQERVKIEDLKAYFEKKFEW